MTTAVCLYFIQSSPEHNNDKDTGLGSSHSDPSSNSSDDYSTTNIPVSASALSVAPPTTAMVVPGGPKLSEGAYVEVDHTQKRPFPTMPAPPTTYSTIERTKVCHYIMNCFSIIIVRLMQPFLAL